MISGGVPRRRCTPKPPCDYPEALARTALDSQAKNDSRLEFPNEIPDQIPTEIQKRFDAVSEQLSHHYPQLQLTHNHSSFRSLLDQLITARRKLAPLRPDEDNIILSGLSVVK